MKFAVVGDPVKQSRSPVMHNAGFAALGIDAVFDFMHIPADGFGEVAEALRSGDLKGVSVTMPHKHNAFEAVDEHSNAAARTGAVNTVTVQDGHLFGHNTDVAGVKYAMDSVGIDDDTPFHLLGYGGAAAAALLAIEGGTIYLSGRDPEKASALIERTGVAATVIPWGTPVPMATVINATPLGMLGESLPDGVVERSGAFIDMVYGDHRLPAVVQALALGIPTVDGLTMLVGQAFEAFELFTGQQAPIHAMEQAARR